MLMSGAQVQLNQPPRRRLGPPIAAGLVVLVLVASAAGGWLWLASAERFPLKAVRLDGRLLKVAEAELQQAILPYLNKGMLGLDIDRIRHALEALPWIAEVTVRRQWPDALVVELVERVAVARWNDGLLSDSGVLFEPRQETFPPKLPLLQGPADSVSSIWARFRRLEAIFGGAGLEITALRLDERRAWTAELTDGVVVKLGVDETDAAAERFVRALPRIGAPAESRLARVDLRYPNGFALAWSSVAPQNPRKQ